MTNSKKIEAGVSSPQAGHLPFSEDLRRQAKTRKFDCVKKGEVTFMAARELLAIYGFKRIGRNVRLRMNEDWALHMRKRSVGLLITRCDGGYLLERDDSKMRKNIDS